MLLPAPRLLAAVLLPALLLTAPVAAVGPSGRASAADVHRSVPVHPNLVEKNSENWSGYVLPMANSTRVSTHFRVPTVDCTIDPNNDYTEYTSATYWVGLDGGLPGATTLEQAGVDTSCDEGVLSMKAFWELEVTSLGGAQKELDKPVAAGDYMTVFVTAVKNQPRAFLFTINDYGAGTPADNQPVWQFREEHSYTANDPEPALNCSEVVVERPVLGFVRKLHALAKFAPADFLRVEINKNPLRSYPTDNLIHLTMLNNTTQPPTGTNILATTGPISTGAADAFTVTWHNYGTFRPY